MRIFALFLCVTCTTKIFQCNAYENFIKKMYEKRKISITNAQISQFNEQYSKQQETRLEDGFKSTLKGIAGSLLEYQELEKNDRMLYDYTPYLIMINAWRRLYSIFITSKERVHNIEQRIRAFEIISLKVDLFFANDISTSSTVRHGCTNTYISYIKNNANTSMENITNIKNRIGVYVLLINQNKIGNEIIASNMTLDEINRSLLNLLDNYTFLSIFGPIISDNNGGFFRFIDRLVTIRCNYKKYQEL